MDQQHAPALSATSLALSTTGLPSACNDWEVVHRAFQAQLDDLTWRVSALEGQLAPCPMLLNEDLWDSAAEFCQEGSVVWRAALQLAQALLGATDLAMAQHAARDYLLTINALDLVDDTVALTLDATLSDRWCWSQPAVFPATAFSAFVQLTQRLVDSAAVPLAGPDGTGAPILTPTWVAFNGCDTDRGEPFEIRHAQLPLGLDPRSGTGGRLAYCKTDGRAYDLVVAATMLALRWHFPEVMLISDGSSGVWEAARALFTQVTGWPAPAITYGGLGTKGSSEVTM